MSDAPAAIHPGGPNAAASTTGAGDTAPNRPAAADPNHPPLPMHHRKVLRRVEHPRERRGRLLVLVALLIVPFTTFFAAPIIWWRRRQTMLHLEGGAARATERQLPELYDRTARARAALGIKRVVHTYVTNDGEVNAYFVRKRGPYGIVITSGAVKELSDEELDFLVYRFLGYVASRRADWGALVGAVDIAADTPILRLLVRPYDQGAVLTGDRVGAAACGNPASGMSTLMKFVAGSDAADQLDIDELVRQAKGTRRNPLSYAAHAFSEHPRLLDRVHDLHAWIQVGDLPRAA